MKKLIKYLSIPTLLFVMSACSSGSSSGGDDSYSYGDSPTGDYSAEGGGGWFSVGGSPTTEGQKIDVPAGQLTCSALNDNDAYEEWCDLSSSNSEKKVVEFETERNKGQVFNTYNRVHLTIKNGNYIRVKLLNNNFSTIVDTFDNAYLFADEALEEYNVQITYLDKDNNEQTLDKTVKDGDEIDLEQEKTLPNALQIMFVIDATGSMGDEINYLKAEIQDVIDTVKADNANSEVSLGILMYRDISDEYVVKYNEFTTDIASQKTFLSQQAASGGGDFEEAVHKAMEEALKAQWNDRGTKLIIHVADAPAHNKDLKSWNDSSILAAQKGIKIITVASSGITKATEYYFRSQSILTGGQYVFLTNHSGIGNSHMDASTTQQLNVEYLNECLIRLIDGYHQGEFKAPKVYNSPAPAEGE